VAEYLRDWLAGLPAAGRRPSTIAGYEHHVRCDVNPILGAIALQALTALDLDALYSSLLVRGLSMSSVRKVHTILGKALHDAERKGIVARNVARLATPPAASAAKAPEMQFWTPSELRSFLNSIEGHHHYPLVRLAAMSGMRRGELCGLRWVDVDLDAGTVSVKRAVVVVDGQPVAGAVKTKRSKRVLDIDPATMAVLRRWRVTQLEHRMLMGAGWRDSGLVFTDPTGEGWHPTTITQAFTRLVAASQLQRIRLHDLRHSHATHLLAAGVNVKVVSDRMGHASVAFTLDVYSHVMPGQQADAAAAVAALVDAL
jgi:integrase